LEDSVVLGISKGAKVPQGIWLCGIDPVWDHWDVKKVLGSNPIGVQVKALLASPLL
jgi:hypothetical protein